MLPKGPSHATDVDHRKTQGRREGPRSLARCLGSMPYPIQDLFDHGGVPDGLPTTESQLAVYCDGSKAAMTWKGTRQTAHRPPESCSDDRK